MYALATDVVDLCEFNTNLIENKTIEKVHDSRYINCEKEWYNRLEEVSLPSVFPIKLGVKLNNDEPTNKYQYVPLDAVADEIRIMVLLPAEDRSAPIRAVMAHCPVHCEVDYSALSYRWGDNSTTEKISLSGQIFHIRTSLAEALRAIRMHDKAVQCYMYQSE
ncbi:hypothetical protein EJ03DRAFT_138504 [Teratosphaeria nubilosa]|uniref:Heterokaryon incompatibility domain-containing protein n=1 Tax=Teratosphaeria nubilosa TaxID=161662 RepID=A0A6G1L635_9PEZI|nr:hypothetical protein EJ03DRAFT_138504 [Teratosphaeria nubilosa]